MIGRGLNASAILYQGALSPVAIDHTTVLSSNPVDLSNFQFGTIIAISGTTVGSGTYKVARSATSNGTFQPFGCSVVTGAAGQVKVRSFVANASAVWHRVTRATTGSQTTAVTLIGHGARYVPITQPTGTTVSGDVNA
jgi:hypothetical protein